MEFNNLIGLLGVAFGFLLTMGCNSKQSAIERVFTTPLPNGTVVVNYDYQSMGPDCAEVFILKTKGDDLLKKLVDDWMLVPSSEPSSAYDRPASSWWPTHKKRTAMEKKFENFDEDKMEFRSVWVDSNGMVYIERGEW